MKRFSLSTVLSTVALGLVALVFAGSPLLAREGFGWPKKKAALHRINPPIIRIDGTRIAVKATAEGRVEQGVATRFAAQFESELLKGDKRFSSDSTGPETLFEVTLLESDGSEEWLSREGTRSVAAGKDEKGKTIYRQERVTLRYKVLRHRFGVAYKVNDLRINRTLTGDTVTIPFQEEFQDGTAAPSLAELEGRAIGRAVTTIVQRLTPTGEAVGVLLPRGSFDDLADLAKAGLWNRYLEKLEGLPPFAKAEEEAYRQYGIGLAHEALGYAAEEIDGTLRYLQEAASRYSAALDANPKEDYFYEEYNSAGFFEHIPLLPIKSNRFAPPHERVRQALVQYQRLKEFKAPEPELTAEATGAKGAGGAAPEAPDDGILDSAEVIALVKAGLEETIILSSIQTADQINFDLSPKGLITLSKGGVNSKIIQAMQTAAKKAAKPAKKAGGP